MSSGLLSALLLASMVIPAAILALGDVALRSAAANPRSSAAALSLTSWFVIQTALISYLAGSESLGRGWRLMLLDRTIILVNSLLGA